MTPEEKSLLERTLKVAQDNNDILRSMRRTARWGTALRVAYWAVIILLSVGAYYFIQPYVEAIGSLYSDATGGSGSTASSYFQDLFK